MEIRIWNYTTITMATRNDYRFRAMLRVKHTAFYEHIARLCYWG